MICRGGRKDETIERARYSSVSLVVFEIIFQVFLGAIARYVVQRYPTYLVLVIPSANGFVLVLGFILLRRKYSRRISALIAGALFTILMLIYYIATLFFYV